MNPSAVADAEKPQPHELAEALDVVEAEARFEVDLVQRASRMSERIDVLKLSRQGNVQSRQLELVNAVEAFEAWRALQPDVLQRGLNRKRLKVELVVLQDETSFNASGS